MTIRRWTIGPRTPAESFEPKRKAPFRRGSVEGERNDWGVARYGPPSCPMLDTSETPVRELRSIRLATRPIMQRTTIHVTSAGAVCDLTKSVFVDMGIRLSAIVRSRFPWGVGWERDHPAAYKTTPSHQFVSGEREVVHSNRKKIGLAQRVITHKRGRQARPPPARLR
jgi:hypothetical protein